MRADVSAKVRLAWTASAAAFLAVVGALDYLTRAELSFAFFYLVPTLLITWVAGRQTGIVVAALAIGVWGVTDAFTLTSHWQVLFWNGAIRLVGFLTGVWLVDRLRASRRNLEAELAARTEAWEEERALRMEMERELEGFSDREQQRLGRELHDGVVQELGALSFQAQMLATDLAAARSPLKRDADRFVSCLNASLTQLREFGRILDPLDGGMCGLPHALQRLVDDAGRVREISCILETSGEVPPLPIQYQVQLYRLVQEAIEASVAHGHAEKIRVGLSSGPGVLVLEIEDDGDGSGPAGVDFAGRTSGLRLMRHRATLLGATLDSRRTEDAGCRLRCTVPLPEAVPSAAKENRAPAPDAPAAG